MFPASERHRSAACCRRGRVTRYRTLAFGSCDGITSSMRRMLLLLILLSFGLSSSVLSPMAMCRHADGAAHEAARHSNDLAEVAVADREEMSALAFEKMKSSLDPLSGGLASMVLPAEPQLPPAWLSGWRPWHPGPAISLTSRSISPPLHPPAHLAA